MQIPLAGRAVFLDLEGFTIAESIDRGMDGPWLENASGMTKASHGRLDVSSTLYEQLWRGFLPEAQFIPLATIPAFYQAYQRTYIERDARLLADVSDWQLFGRFMRLAESLTGREINHSEFGREIGVTPQTAGRRLDILKATFQWDEIPAFSGNAVRKVSGKPKGYISDTGLACLARAISSPNAIGGHPLWGFLFEPAVVAEIGKLCLFLSPSPVMYHWRAYGGAEVDIILEYDGIYFPMEIKAKTNPGKRDTSGISAFRTAYHTLINQ